MNNKQIITILVVAVAAMAIGYFIGTGTTGYKTENQVTMKNQTDSLNYFLGLVWGYTIGEAPWEPDADLLASGIMQVLKDSSSFAMCNFFSLSVVLQAKAILLCDILLSDEENTGLWIDARDLQ